MIIVLGYLTLNLYFPGVTFAGESEAYTANDVKVAPIEVRKTPEQEFPDPNWISRNKWWVIGGLTVGGAVVFWPEPSKPKPTPTTGDYTFSW